jgi:hypothetical protein
LRPWRDDRDARRLLSFLAGVAVDDPFDAGGLDPASIAHHYEIADWLARLDLAGLGYAWAVRAEPRLAEMLRGAAMGAAAANLLHLETLRRIESAFAAERIPMIVLKGAAIAGTAYRDPGMRPMTDVDIWIDPDDMPRAMVAMGELGYRQAAGLPGRPHALQRRSDGEVPFRPTEGQGLVELHYGPFQGWWSRRTAIPDAGGLRRRARPLGPGRHAHGLAPDDALVQTAFHVAVNQFGQSPVRGIMDLGVLARRHAVDWTQVWERLRAWRLAMAVGLVLNAADRLVGLPGYAAQASRTPAIRAAALSRVVSPRRLLAGRAPSSGLARHLFMLTLADRKRDALRLIGRTLWPERWWIDARYGRPVSRAAHVWSLLARGEA